MPWRWPVGTQANVTIFKSKPSRSQSLSISLNREENELSEQTSYSVQIIWQKEKATNVLKVSFFNSFSFVQFQQVIKKLILGQHCIASIASPPFFNFKKDRQKD